MLSIYLSMLEQEAEKLKFERIYRKYYRGVYLRIYKIVKNKEDAEDVAQETWLKAVKHFDELAGKGEITVIAYIMRIARNEAISLIRKVQKELQNQEDLNDRELVSEEDFFAMLEDRSEEHIVRCIRALDPTYSDVLVYYYLYHYTVDEIARLLHISSDAVRKRMTRGRTKLAVMLQKEGIL
ncbi:MAG: RNA polymerase sigma factor [Clostridia bacterium]|nr:RNA polymerase sigma factor [Clostridia bacterium]